MFALCIYYEVPKELSAFGMNCDVLVWHDHNTEVGVAATAGVS